MHSLNTMVSILDVLTLLILPKLFEKGIISLLQTKTLNNTDPPPIHYACK